MNKAKNLYHIRVVSNPEILLKDAPVLDTPDKAGDFLFDIVSKDIVFNPDKENGIVLFLNTRRKITGYEIIGNGTLDTLLMHPREVFRAAIARNASGIIIAHNHPSGDPMPSEADIKVTKDLIRAGQVIKIDLLDHIVFSSFGREKVSLRELGYLFS